MAEPERLDDRRLREESLKAFVKALHTDRMVAITGAMSTRALGYPSWDELVKGYAIIARTLAKDICNARRHEPSFSQRPAANLLDEIFERSDRLELHHDSEFDVRVSMWALHDCFRRLDQQMRHLRSGLVIDDQYQKPALEQFEKRIARMFQTRTFGPKPLSEHPTEAAIRQLIASLGIKRVATFNYDLELERAFMLRDDERRILSKNEALLNARLPIAAPSAAELFATKAKLKRSDIANKSERMASVKDFIGVSTSGKPIVRSNRHRLNRTMGNGVTVESDVVDRERSDRLFEFAIGSAEIGRHILHLHGRADVPDTMVANIRQYDRLYRLDDLHRDPFDHGLRVLFGGNPLLFVGLGMAEPELQQILQYFVSNLPIRRPAPTFLIWNTNTLPADRDKEQYKTDKRLEFRAKFGVHLLFDDDIVQPFDDQWRVDLECRPKGDKAVFKKERAQLDSERELMNKALRPLETIFKMIETDGDAPDKERWDELRSWSWLCGEQRAKLDAMVRDWADAREADKELQAERSRKMLKGLAVTLSKLPELVARIDQRIDRFDAWRSIDARLDFADPKRGEGPFRLYGSKGTQETAANQIANHGSLPNHAMIELRDSSDGPSNLIIATAPAGYGRGTLGEYLAQMDDRGLIIGKARLRATRRQNRLMVNAGFSYDSDTMLVGIARFLQRRCPDLEGREISRERHFADGSLLQTEARTLVIINGAERFFSLDGIPLSAELDHMLRCVRDHVDGDVQVLLLGTERLRRYAKSIDVQCQQLPGLHPKYERADLGLAAGSQGVTDEEPAEKFSSGYFDLIRRSYRKKIDEAQTRIRKRDRDPERIETELRDAEISAAGEALMRRAEAIDRDASPRTFYEAYLSPSLLQALDVPCAAAFEILRTMCFIGGPIEAAVLLYAPKVRAILAERPRGEKAGTDMIKDDRLPSKLFDIMRTLHELGLIIRLDPHEPTPTSGEIRDGLRRGVAKGPYRKALSGRLWTRYALHRSLTTFLRDRHGAPINDAKLATTFNMSLFMSDPSENYTPEPDFHDELGQLVDSLIGGWHDITRFYGGEDYPLPLGAEMGNYREQLAELYIHRDDEGFAGKSVVFRSSRVAAACLRCALSLVRNYYSTGALLKLDRDRHIAKAERDGALTEHAHRLDRMITAFGDISVARKIMKAMFAKSPEHELKERKQVRDVLPEAEREAEERKVTAFEALIPQHWQTFARVHMGPDPFYADDLVWLHNERGVVALTQGHLFDAREAFSAAETVNKKHVEHSYAGHNWRRISINQVATRIERGMLKPAERLLDKIEGTINAAPRQDPAAVGDGHSHIERIRAMFRDNPDPPVHGNRVYTREAMLMAAMTTGYRGLIANMYGRYHEAEEKYQTAILILQRLNEQRAVAHFQRHFASLLRDKDSAREQVSHAIRAAQSAQQMDILHRARVVRADLRYKESAEPELRRKALQDIKSALRYAALSDCYRVRIEASTSLARHMRESGDYDTALRYATDALTTASRYGHSLHKTMLRIEIAQILMARGDPRSGEALLEQAIEIASSKGYYLALERVRSARNNYAASKPMPNRTDIPVSS